MWFEALTGFAEESPEQVRANLTVDGPLLRSRVNGATLVWGSLETPTLGELRQRVQAVGTTTTTVREVVGDVQELHADEGNAGALFQVASQFNLLEMASPGVTPEQGVGIYEHDRTQGPACAVAAGAGTIYRNYFAPVNGQTGQSAANQIDCLADLGAALGNADGHLWQMRNGYALPTYEGLQEISRRLQSSSEEDRDALRQLLRIGIQGNTQITIRGCTHTVSQGYCSALPVAYGGHPTSMWADFARLVLEASYEATLCAAMLNAAGGGSNRVYLTALGGGVFGNDRGWILEAMERALRLASDAGLDVAIVSYGSSRRDILQLVTRCGSLRRGT